MKVRALEQSNVKREYLLRLKHAFDKADIRQPQSTVTIIERGGRGAASATPRRPALLRNGVQTPFASEYGVCPHFINGR